MSDWICRECGKGFRRPINMHGHKMSHFKPEATEMMTWTDLDYVFSPPTMWAMIEKYGIRFKTGGLNGHIWIPFEDLKDLADAIYVGLGIKYSAE